MKFYGKRSLFAAVAILVLSQAPAWAATEKASDDEARKRAEEMFRQWDKNGDGKLSRSEYPGTLSFEKADRNGDGFITRDEVGLAPQSRPSAGELFKLWDANGDGRLSKEEYRGAVPFGDLDKNRDGFLSKEELGISTYPVQQRGGAFQYMLENWDKDGDGKISRTEWKGKRSFESVDADGDGFITQNEVGISPSTPRSMNYEGLLEAWDEDGDGKISRSEWRGRFPFNRIDKNKDGFITREEMEPPADKGGAPAK